MVTQAENPNDPRGLLGLRPPAELAEGVMQPRVEPAPAAEDGTPQRPHYPVVSSGWDEEDSRPAGKTSDLMTAVLAGGVLLAAMVVLGLLIG
ncbi:hypothetical protein [Falsiroseomonas sp.]|uniref:hypothetical protein n=1 Tax=Falsiroseomonas sp. TaxID=2870721 RepID=UPI003F71ABBD